MNVTYALHEIEMSEKSNKTSEPAKLASGDSVAKNPVTSKTNPFKNGGKSCKQPSKK